MASGGESSKYFVTYTFRRRLEPDPDPAATGVTFDRPDPSPIRADHWVEPARVVIRQGYTTTTTTSLPCRHLSDPGSIDHKPGSVSRVRHRHAAVAAMGARPGNARSRRLPSLTAVLLPHALRVPRVCVEQRGCGVERSWALLRARRSRGGLLQRCTVRGRLRGPRRVPQRCLRMRMALGGSGLRRNRSRHARDRAELRPHAPLARRPRRRDAAW